ncbi:hypothetical protein HYX14_01555 [Candidatus Woesearchaeota archaeon]|nr:hypothetical protein [Candidatus Woesearchaeota archaeon]
MNFKLLLVVGLLVLPTLMILSTFFLGDVTRCSSLQTLDAFVQVKSSDLRYLGFNLDTDALKFGVVSPGARGKRVVMVNNTLDSTVVIKAVGEMAAWMNVTPQNFTFKAYHPQRVEFELFVPPDAKEGDYTGKVLVCHKA